MIGQNNYFFHNHTKKALIAFGYLFRNIKVKKKRGRELIVPFGFSTKQNFVSRIKQIQSENSRNDFSRALPKIGYEIISLTHDSSRKTTNRSAFQNLAQPDISGNPTNPEANVKVIGPSVPYNLELDLHIYAKYQSDAFQIIEQILPSFNPDFSVYLNTVPDLKIKEVVKITLNNIDYTNQYFGDMEDRQIIIWTLKFTLNLNYHGEVNNANLITSVSADIFQNDDETGLHVKQTYTASFEGEEPITITDFEELTPDDYIIDEDIDENISTS